MAAPALSEALEDLAETSASPGAARTTLARLLEARPEAAEALEQDGELAQNLVRVVAASRSLGRLVVSDAGALQVLGDLSGRLETDASGPESLARWKRLELLRIAARDLAGTDPLERVGDELSRVAEAVLESSCLLSDPLMAERICVIGMGKLGGEELNYASDIDVVFAGTDSEGDERRVRRLMGIARLAYRVDAALRPEGRDGPLVRSTDSYRLYWQRWAQPWEIQALIKARAVAGSPHLGREFEESAAGVVWTRKFGADELRSVREMKARTEEAVRRHRASRTEVKRGPGGIRDVEMAVQLLQLVHGRHDPDLRVRSTLPAIAELAAAGYVALDDALALEDAYRFLRTVEHRLQLVEEAQVHTVPDDPGPREHLARVMGFRDEPGRTALAAFDDELARHRSTVRSIHERLYFRPLLEAFAGLSLPSARTGGADSPTMDAQAATERLRAFGFRDAERTREALRELTGGLTRSSRLMVQMLPLLLQWLSDAPDPDLGLLGLRQLATGAPGASLLLTTFRESPEAARRLCLLIGTSRLLLDYIRRNPELISALADDDSLAARGREELLELARTAVGWRRDPKRRQVGLLRFKQAELVRIATRDVLGMDRVEETGRAITDLCEALVEQVMGAIGSRVPLAAIAMGRLGGAEMSYVSDLDMLLVFDGQTNRDVAAAQEASESLLRVMKGATPAERVFTLDPGLRPEGSKGPLARSLEGYRSYYARWAATWERQALVRARPIAGDPEVAGRFMEMVDEFVWSAPLDDEGQREIRRMKARIERERLPPSEDPRFHLKLGRGSLSDVEWTAQLLQLRHQVRAPGTMQAISALEREGVLSEGDARVLSDSFTFCTRARNRWYLVRSAPGDALPSQPDWLARLARSLEVTPAELREEYRRVTRRARQVVERLFYGIEPSQAQRREAR
jgi:glutamate-ammonia-ligase adenylyltransferase